MSATRLPHPRSPSPRLRLGRQHGVALAEFALVLPLLLLIVFAVVAFSVALLDRVVLVNAAREAARFGSVYRTDGKRPTLPQVQQVAQDYCTSNLLTFGSSYNCSPAVSPDPATLSTGATLTVTVQYPFTFLGLSGFIDPLGGQGSLLLKAGSSMRAE